jgi:putative two-component system response regulator
MTADFSITILVVDDEATNLNVLRQILKQHYRLLFAKSPEDALELADAELPDLILLDVMMPEMNGYQVCEKLKHNVRTQHIPVIFVSALSDAAEEAQGFAVGGVDYITKPVSGAIVRARVATHLSLVRVDELKKTRLEIVQRLGLAAEYKDNETGLHVIRMSHYSHIIARAAGFDEAMAEDLLHAAPMHDIGKIGIPDSILQKPGKLTPDEWAVMREHPVIGARIIGVHPAGLLHMAHDIALTHHERWDGSGYPRGLQGEDIPMVGRIVAVADVFDALTTQRPYKKAWPLNEAVAYIREQRGKHFDPQLVELFLEQLPAILEIKERWAEKI